MFIPRPDLEDLGFAHSTGLGVTAAVGRGTCSRVQRGACIFKGRRPKAGGLGFLFGVPFEVLGAEPCFGFFMAGDLGF